jgi:putative ABC transport system permease protein
VKSGPEGFPIGAAAALARVLLLLYPRSFRMEVGSAMVGDVRRRAADLTGRQTAARASVWLVRLTASLLLNAGAAWVERARRVSSAGPTFSWLDLKLALRILVRYPGLTLTGGLGIAVAMAIVVGFFTTNTWYFHPTIPLSEGDRLVGLENWDRRTSREERRSLYDFVQWREAMQSVEDMSAFHTVARNLISEGASVELVQVAAITPSGFRLARVPPLLGRTLVDSDAAPGAPPVVVIGYDVWRTRFASAPDIIGRDVRLSTTLHTIVGVMPEGFAFPINHRFWTPLQIDPLASRRGEGPSIYISGRLAPGFDLAAAQAELTVIGNRMAVEFPDTHKHLNPAVLPYAYPFAGMGLTSSEDLVLINALFGLILVVVSGNVAILVYARTATRVGEIAVRSALGASRGRIVAQLFAEALVLAAVAGAVGVGLVNAALGLMTRIHTSPPFWTNYRLSESALVYAAALTVLTAVVTGVVPALQATGRRLQSNLCRASYVGMRLGRTWTALIVVQVALAVTVVPIVVALGWWEVRELISTPAFAVDQFLVGELGSESPERFARVRTELSRRLDAEPGFAGHAFMLDAPSDERDMRVAIENHTSRIGSAAPHDVQGTAVDVDYFKTLDIGVVAGRAFQSADHDGAAADVVIVSRAFSDQLLADGNVLGRRIRYLPQNTANPGEPVTERWYEIVGVVDNIETSPFARVLGAPRVYRPLKATESSPVAVLVRVKGIDHAAAATRLRDIAAAVDPTLTVDTIPISEIYRFRRTLQNAGAAGIAAAVLSVLLLSAAGIYALMSFTVAQRRREIAIRMALGAKPGQLLGDVFARALRQISLGVVIGIAMALLLDRAADGDALSGNAAPLLSIMVVVMSLVGLFAALGPARRGLRIEPSETLKAE